MKRRLSHIKRHLLFAVAAAALVSILPLRSTAQEQPTIYTRVAQWQIARTNWQAYEKDLQRTRPLMDKLLADGAITEYGADSVSVHRSDGYTHSTWFSAKSLAGLERALEVLVAADEKLSAEEQKKQNTEFAGTKHSDVLLRSILYQSRSVKSDRGYIMVSSTVVQPGRGREYRDLWEKYTKPVYERLFADGTLTSYGMDAELVHTEDSGLRSAWYVVSSPEALDKVQIALNEASRKRSVEENRAIGRSFADVTVPGSHRDYLSRIIQYSARY